MYGMNENQNIYMDGKRTASRVTNEPGGKSSVHLGWDSPKTKEPKDTKKEKENRMQVVGSAAAAAHTKTNTGDFDDKGKAKQVREPNVGRRGTSSNQYASGSSQNTGNVITDRPTSRVTQPPGGRSSISFY